MGNGSALRRCGLAADLVALFLVWDSLGGRPPPGAELQTISVPQLGGAAVLALLGMTLQLAVRTGVAGPSRNVPVESRTCAYSVSNAFRDGFLPVDRTTSSMNRDASCSEPSSPSSQNDVTMTSARVPALALMTVRPKKWGRPSKLGITWSSSAAIILGNWMRST